MRIYTLESDCGICRYINVANLEKAVEKALALAYTTGEPCRLGDENWRMIGRVRHALFPSRFEFLPVVESDGRRVIEDRPGWKAVVEGDTVKWIPVKERD